MKIEKSLTRVHLERESAFLSDGHQIVLGCDEVGRGALAGPVAVGMVIVDRRCLTIPEGLRDSKQVPEKQRSVLADQVKEFVVSYAIGFSDAKEIDEFGIIQCQGLAAFRAWSTLCESHESVRDAPILLDGTQDWLTARLPRGTRVVTVVKGDNSSASIASAAILAKVERDGVMTTLHDSYPQYLWSKNKGYGTKAHRDLIDRYGASEFHRMSWLGAGLGWKNNG